MYHKVVRLCQGSNHVHIQLRCRPSNMHEFISNTKFLNHLSVSDSQLLSAGQTSDWQLHYQLSCKAQCATAWLKKKAHLKTTAMNRVWNIELQGLCTHQNFSLSRPGMDDFNISPCSLMLTKKPWWKKPWFYQKCLRCFFFYKWCGNINIISFPALIWHLWMPAIHTLDSWARKWERIGHWGRTRSTVTITVTTTNTYSISKCSWVYTNQGVVWFGYHIHTLNHIQQSQDKTRDAPIRHWYRVLVQIQTQIAASGIR